jgi:subtilisin family serine protease
MSYMWVNMDLGQYRGVFRTAAEHLSAGGVLPLGGAGNFAKSAPEGKQICNPKDIPCVVAVAGVLEDGKRPEFSSLGPCSWTGVRFYDDYPADQPHRKPDLTAPAGDFPCWMRATPAASGPQWKSLWKGKSSDSLVTGPKGNSFAGPHVAGTAALVLSANPELNAWQVKRILEETSKDLGEPGPDYQHGAGLVQALDAVRAARKAKKVD